MATTTYEGVKNSILHANTTVPPMCIRKETMPALPVITLPAPRRVSDELRQMAREALEEDDAGLTEGFPPA
jgi:hypothetical protein